MSEEYRNVCSSVSTTALPDERNGARATTLNATSPLRLYEQKGEKSVDSETESGKVQPYLSMEFSAVHCRGQTYNSNENFSKCPGVSIPYRPRDFFDGVLTELQQLLCLGNS